MQFRVFAFLAVVGIVMGCRGDQSTPSGLATISPCPNGATEVVVGRFDEACLRRMVNWNFTVPLLVPGYREPTFEIDTPTSPLSLTALFGPESEAKPILKVTMTREGPVAVPTRRYDRVINGVTVSFGTSSGVPTLLWRDASGHLYLATLRGGSSDPTKSDQFAEQLAASIVFP